jgi:N-acetylglucosaminyldiphosphoundecaprenol N-acetyl-beta-D-mannosaminyltransferase
MRDYGLEWAHRLASEPRRLWRRYLIQAPRFVFANLRELATRPRV